MENLELLKKLWHWLPVPPGSFSPTRWTEAAVDCLRLNRNCAECPIFKTLGLHWSGFDSKHCKQPYSVQRLINRDEEIPKSFMQAHHKRY